MTRGSLAALLILSSACWSPVLSAVACPRIHPRWQGSMVSHTVAWWSVPALLRRGKFLDEFGSKALADRAFEQAVGMDGSSVRALMSYANFLQKRAEEVPSSVDKAAEMYERVLYLDCEHLGAMCSYGLLLHSYPLEHWDEAEELYERVLARDPKHSSTLFNYANLQEVRDDGKGSSAAAEMLYDEGMRATDSTTVDQARISEVSGLAE